MEREAIMKITRETFQIYSVMILAIFLAEFAVMLSLDYLIEIPNPYNGLIDALALSLITSFALFPLLVRYRQRAGNALLAVGIANEGFWVVDGNGHFLDVNEGYCRLVGFRADVILKKRLDELENDPATLDSSDRHLRETLSQGHAKYETRHRHRDGRWIDLEISMSYIDAGHIVGFVRDIGEKAAKERRARFLTQIYAALFHTNRAIWESKSESELFDNLCRVSVEHGGMALVWIGRIDDDDDLIRPVASYGEGHQYIDGLAIGWRANHLRSQGPTATAYREGRSIFIQDFCTDPMTAPWHEKAKPYGWGASAALGVRRGGKSYAVISYYRYEKHSFTREIIDLLNEVARDIGHALDRFDIQKERQRAMELIQENANRYHCIIESSLDGFWMVDLNGRLLEVNDAYMKRSGYSREELLNLRLPDLNKGMDAKQIQDVYRRLQTDGHAFFETKHRAKDGSLWPVEVSSGFLNQEDGRFFSFIRDIGERRKSEEEMLIAASVFDSHEAMLVTDSDRNVFRANKAFTKITGYAAEEVIGKNPRILGSGFHDRDFYREMWSRVDREGSWKGEIVDKRKNGELYPTWLTISSVKNDQGQVTHYVGGFTDITEYKAAQERIEALAFYDQLTGLPNRWMLMDRLEHALASSARSHRCGAILYLDLDHFKTINDTVGHDCGDEVLRETAKRLRASVRQEDTTARLGGDEFVVLLEDIGPDKEHAAAHAKLVGDKVLAMLAGNYSIRGKEYPGSVSIGVTLFCGQLEGIHELLKRADLAMYEAKKVGRNTLRFFDPFMQETLDKRMLLEFDLRHALEEGEFRLHFQKLVENSGRTVGAEVLLRWEHPQRGIVPPLDFIPLAEDTGLIIPIGRWVFEQSCRTLYRWQATDCCNNLQLSVNLSALEFGQDDFVEHVAETLKRTGVNPSMLSLEITESLLMENMNDFVPKMNRLQDLGLSFSLDDFGTGYSSLSYLKLLPIKRLKIDKSFVKDLGQDKNDEAIAKTIIQMSKTLGMDVVAEGVETATQAEMLKQFGCNIFQGYLYGRPVELEVFEGEL